MRKTQILLLLVVVAFLATSVGSIYMLVAQQNSDTKKQEEINKAAQELQTQNEQKEKTLDPSRKLDNFEPVAKVTELQKIDTKPGTGEEVKPGATISAHYTGAIAATGVIFQSNRDFGKDPISFGLSDVIKGWTDGVPGMKVGGIRRLLIPAALAYGANPPAGSGIPANADLVFDIELMVIDKQGQ